MNSDDLLGWFNPDDETLLNIMFIVREWIRDLPFPTDIPIMGISLCLNRLETFMQESCPLKPVMRGRAWKCGKCNQILGIVGDDIRDNYCRSCGKKVDWGVLNESSNKT